MQMGIWCRLTATKHMPIEDFLSFVPAAATLATIMTSAIS
jgi:hypothetical protein